MLVKSRSTAFVVAAVAASVLAFGQVPGSPDPTEGGSGQPETTGELQLVRSLDISRLGITGPSGVSWNEEIGGLLVTHGQDGEARVSGLTPDEYRLSAASVEQALSGGIPGRDDPAIHPETGQLFRYDATGRRVVGFDPDGSAVVAYAAAGIGLHRFRGMTFGPSSDATDHPSTLSLYIADAGVPGADGRILESFIRPVGLAAHVVVQPSQVRVIDTSAYDPPSPDPSGLAYLPGADRLFIADGEVDEMSIFEGSNLFATTRAGAVTALGVSQPWSDEPVGVGYNPLNNHLFISDDDQKEVFELVAGSDGRFGTGDDTVTHFDTAGFGNTDPEGLDYDPATGSIWLVDGVNADVFRVRPGTDGRFGTSDDVETRFDVGIYGARDPEGLGYDSARDTVVIVDDSSDRIYELDKSGALLNTIDTSAANMRAAAGLAVGPSTVGSGRSYYVVARGEDNDGNPNENDGRMYEISAALTPVGDTNQAPQVNAGVDQSVVLPASAELDGTVTDDGKPSPPGAVTTTWSQVSGPGTATFTDASAQDTGVTFSAQGSYVLRLTASDGAATSADDIAVFVAPAGGANVVEARGAAGTDDAEQALSGFTALTSSDLELTTDGNTQQVVGVRFPNLQIPVGATITRAYVQFRTDEVSTGAASLTVRAEAANNAPTYANTSGNITSRATTAASVAWTPPDWNSVGQVGTDQRTPDVSSLVQAVVSRTGWASGNAVALQISGTGRRTAEAFEGGTNLGPMLHVEYTTDGGGDPTNVAPVVDAGADQSVTLPASASLDGAVSDDGLPNPPAGVTTMWSQVSGPGTTTFGDVASVDTTASFSVDGTYVLRLTADDSEMTGSDEVTVTVAAAGTTNEAPVVDAGVDQSVSLPASASLDGSVSDDGLPNPPAGVTTAWSQVSGPGTVTFGDVASVDTTASFSADGTYVLRLTANDGALTGSDQVTVTVSPEAGGGGGGAQTFEARVATGSDDAEQSPNGSVHLPSNDLELTMDGNTQQIVGVRFAGVQVPAGATITQAWIQFRVDEVSSGAAALTIRAEAADNPVTYSSVANNVSSRSMTAASVSWAPPDWTIAGAATAGQRTPNLAALVQAVVTRTGWASGNAMAFQISGAGRRVAEAFEGGANFAPQLHIEYTTDGGGGGGGGGDPTNVAPVVDAGVDQSVSLPASASLDGSVSDDGLPNPPAGVTTAWSQVSGPGTTTFADFASVDTSASFSQAGSYVLRLAADDGALTGSDTVTVTVSPAAGGGGGAQTFEVRVASGSDDAEQSLRGSVHLTSNDLELTTDGNTQQVDGIRFAGVQVPAGATITQAWIQFRVDEASSGAIALTIRAEAADNPTTYLNTSGSITARATTAASVAWAPPDWTTVGEAALDQRTPNLAALVQELINRSGWVAGNAMAFQISGAGRRVAEAFEGGANFAPQLHIEYTLP